MYVQVFKWSWSIHLWFDHSQMMPASACSLLFFSSEDDEQHEYAWNGNAKYGRDDEAEQRNLRKRQFSIESEDSEAAWKEGHAWCIHMQKQSGWSLESIVRKVWTWAGLHRWWAWCNLQCILDLSVSNYQIHFFYVFFCVGKYWFNCSMTMQSCCSFVPTQDVQRRSWTTSCTRQHEGKSTHTLRAGWAFLKLNYPIGLRP